MRVFGLWHGGPSYSAPDYCDAERFASIAAAEDEWFRRENGDDPYYPGVSESEMWLYVTDPGESDDPYPDWVVRAGKRGGILRERA